MTANESKSYFGYFNKLVGENNNPYYLSIGKSPVNADYPALTEKIETCYDASKIKVCVRARITIHKNCFSKITRKNSESRYFS